MHTLVLLSLSIVSLFGIAVSAIVNGRKKRPNICNPSEHCEAVLSSRYSNFLGVPLERLGLLFYTCLFLSTVAIISLLVLDRITDYGISLISFVLLGVTGAGFAMSVYLVFVQAFYIRMWCTWCLRSAFTATLAFILSIIFAYSTEADVVGILVAITPELTYVHLVTFALALVCATLSDIVLIRFMRTLVISERVERTFRYASQLALGLLFIVILTFVGIYAPDIIVLQQNPHVAVQLIAIAVIATNACFLNLFVSPHVYDMVTKKTISISRTRTYRRIAFALAAMSFVAWYSAFAFALYPHLEYHIGTLVVGYIVATIIATLLGLLFEKLSCGRSATVAY